MCKCKYLARIQIRICEALFHSLFYATSHTIKNLVMTILHWMLLTICHLINWLLRHYSWNTKKVMNKSFFFNLHFLKNIPSCENHSMKNWWYRACLKSARVSKTRIVKLGIFELLPGVDKKLSANVVESKSLPPNDSPTIPPVRLQTYVQFGERVKRPAGFAPWLLKI